MPTRKKLLPLFLILLIFPNSTFATGNQQCSDKGYTVATVNGIFTDEIDAKRNSQSLALKLNKEYNGQQIKIEYLVNPSHLGGVGDLLVAAYQKYFDNETVEDYDLVEMLKDASKKVTTQKLLLIAHSQGNFYANSFYDTVAGKSGGVPEESIGVYSVATPSGRVAGGGMWLTSDTDKVIANIAERTALRTMEPNVHIELNADDDRLGHNFSGVYLKYKSGRVISDIESSLAHLKTNNEQNENESCLQPPKITISHKIGRAVLAVADPVANTSRDAIVFAVSVAYRGSVFVVDVGVRAAKASARAAANVASAAYSAVKSLANGNGGVSPADSGAASIALALEQLTKVPVQTPAPTKVVDTKIEQVSSKPEEEEKKKELPEKEDSGLYTEPEIVFIGPPIKVFGRGGTARVPTNTDNMISLTLEVPEPEIALPSPVITVPQCDFSLATDGCLLATTTVHFSWTQVEDADYYQIDDNGVVSTTTDTALNILVPDFSDYEFGVLAVSSATTSATSTIAVSIATIPIAINEIAWMGTLSSTNEEWMEIKNNTGHVLDLSQWAITTADDAPYIALSGVMTPYEYRVLERRADTIIADAAIDTYGNGASKWALGNGGEKLILSYASTTLDSTPDISGGAWAAGYNSTTTRGSMERYSSKESGENTDNWSSNLGFIKNGTDSEGNVIDGTPGERNSVSYLINKGRTITEDLSLTAADGYFISTSTVVSVSSTLSMEPGVVVKFMESESGSGVAELKIFGRLLVRGTDEDAVIFEAFSGEHIGRISFIGGAAATSTMEFVRVENINEILLSGGARLEMDGAQFIGNKFGVEAEDGSTLLLNNASFLSTEREAISAYGASVVSIASSTIFNTLDADAVGVYDGTHLSVASTTIDGVYDGGGIVVYDSTVSVASSTVSNIFGGDGIGVYNGEATITDSIIKDIYSGDAVGLYSASSTITNTAVQNGENSGIIVYGGDAIITGGSASNFSDGNGIIVVSPENPVVISDIEVSGNGIGIYADATESVSISPGVSVHDNESDLVIND